MSSQVLDLQARMMSNAEIEEYLNGGNLPGDLDATLISYPTDRCSHFATFRQEIGGMIFGSVPADDDIREVEVCRDCGEIVVDEYRGTEYPLALEEGES